MNADIVYMRDNLIGGWRAACETVATERIYLGRLTMMPLEAARGFAQRQMDNDWPMYCALDHGEVIGWADITPVDIPECAHRGVLGMGVISRYRSKGLGRALLDASMDHAARCGITKVELTVYTHNLPAIGLYRSVGFTDIGVIRDYRRLDGEVYDAVMMEAFVAPK